METLGEAAGFGIHPAALPLMMFSVFMVTFTFWRWILERNYVTFGLAMALLFAAHYAIGNQEGLLVSAPVYALGQTALIVAASFTYAWFRKRGWS